MDVYCKKSLNTFRKYDLVLARSGNYDTLTNAFIGSVPQNDFIKYCIDNLIKYKDSYSMLGNHIHIMNSTGPFYINNRANEYKLNKKKHNYYILRKEEYTGDCNVCNIDTCDGGTYFGHVKGNSWHSFDSTLYNSILCIYKTLI
jgi:mannosyltransferase OCH1-like enzyme